MGLYKIIKKEGVEIGIWKITESLNELKQIAGEILLTKYKSEKRKKEILINHILIDKIDPKNKLKYIKSGAPILTGNKYISISHTNKLVAIIVSNKKVGMDIEVRSNKALQLASKFIIKKNRRLLNTDKATLIWCAKEAIYKWHRKGNVSFKNDIIINDFNLKETGEIS